MSNLRQIKREKIDENWRKNIANKNIKEEK
jgi:hypothetical protein